MGFFTYIIDNGIEGLSKTHTSINYFTKSLYLGACCNELVCVNS